MQKPWWGAWGCQCPVLRWNWVICLGRPYMLRLLGIILCCKSKQCASIVRYLLTPCKQVIPSIQIFPNPSKRTDQKQARNRWSNNVRTPEHHPKTSEYEDRPAKISNPVVVLMFHRVSSHISLPLLEKQPWRNIVAPLGDLLGSSEEIFVNVYPFYLKS